MARTNTPTISTYETKRIAFLRSIDSRFPTLTSNATYLKDFSLKNLLIEENPGVEGAVETKYYLRPRPPANVYYSVTSTIGTNGRGCFFVPSTVPGAAGHIITVIGNKVFYDGTPTLTLITSSGHVGFCTFLSTSNVPQIFLCDGINGWLSPNSGISWTVIGSNFPSPHIPSPVFLDGYIFLNKYSTQDIYNCVLNDPTTWNTGDFISAEMYGDTIVGLARNNHFIYAIGEQSIEYFYDAANPTGTPLARHESAVQQFGGICSSAIVQTDTDVYLIGNSGDGDLSMWCIDGFKAKDVGTTAIKQFFSLENSVGLHTGQYCTTFILSVVRLGGRKMIVVKLTDSARTFVYDIKADCWIEWTSGSSVSNQADFLGNYFTSNGYSIVYVTGNNDSNIYAMSSMDTSGLTEAGNPVISQITTSKQDFGTINRKMMSRLSFIADSGTASVVTNTATVEWTDDDYNTWSTPRTLTFSNELPTLFQLGNFRRRAFRFKFNAGQFFRFEGIEVDINKGTA